MVPPWLAVAEALPLGRFGLAVEFYRQAREANRGKNWYAGRLARDHDDTSGLATVLATRDDITVNLAKALRKEKP